MTRISASNTVRSIHQGDDTAFEATPRQLDPAQWSQAIGLARQACARIFRDGGSPEDALRVFGVARDNAGPDHATHDGDWSKVVAMIADTLCRQTPLKSAA